MPRSREPELLTIRESFSQLTVDELKPLVALIHGPVQSRKGELVEILAELMESPEKVRGLYNRMGEISKRVVEEATHDPLGELHGQQFWAKYGRAPDYGQGGRYDRHQKPTELRLFFPHYQVLPTDLHTMLEKFIPEPPPLTVNTLDEVPVRVKRPHKHLGQYYSKPDEEEVELQVRETARAALIDIKTLLRLVDAGEIKVSDKTRRPSQASMKAIRGVPTPPHAGSVPANRSCNCTS